MAKVNGEAARTTSAMSMRGTTTTTRSVDLDYSLGPRAMSTRASTKMTNVTDMEKCTGLTSRATKASGSAASSTATDECASLTAIKKRATLRTTFIKSKSTSLARTGRCWFRVAWHLKACLKMPR